MPRLSCNISFLIFIFFKLIHIWSLFHGVAQTRLITNTRKKICDPKNSRPLMLLLHIKNILKLQNFANQGLSNLNVVKRSYFLSVHIEGPFSLMSLHSMETIISPRLPEPQDNFFMLPNVNSSQWNSWRSTLFSGRPIDWIGLGWPGGACPERHSVFSVHYGSNASLSLYHHYV